MTTKVAPMNDEREHLPLVDSIKPAHTELFEFSNTEAIKERVRKSKEKKPPYSVHDCYKDDKTSKISWIAKHPRFENATLGVICINALWISIDTDLNKAETINNADAVFIAADCLFFGYFFIELLIRFLAFQRKCNCRKDGWFVFDTVLVTLYAFDPFTLGIVAAASGGKGLNLPLAVLRLCRLARLSRLVRMLRSLPELMIMIKGMVTATASVGYTLGLLMVITYVFAIALRNLVPSDSVIEEEYISTVPETMHNLIIYGTFCDALSDFIGAIKEDSAACLIASWLYIALASLTVMNMLIGVLCEVITAVAEEEKESMIVDKVWAKFMGIVKKLDQNGDGKLSWDEFIRIINFDEAIAALESVNVDPETLIDAAEDFFFEDDCGVRVPTPIPFKDFMSMLLDLRGGQQATVKDVMDLGKRVNRKFSKTSKQMNNIEHQLETLVSEVKKVEKARA
jgi:hypothetical protein